MCAMFSRTDDVRIENLRPLIPPAILMEELAVSEAGQELVARARRAAADILHRRDDRLVVVVGPCSIHDPAAGLEYAGRLQPHRWRTSRIRQPCHGNTRPGCAR